MKFYKTCRICKAVYFNKVWHHGDSVKISEIKRSHFSWTTRCPACKLIESKTYAGMITITNIPTITSRELMFLIKSFGKREFQKNCQRRVIEITKQSPHSWVVTTTDNQMANKLAHRISQAFDHVGVKISDTDGEKPVKKFFVEFLPIFYHRFNFERGW